MSDRPDQAGDAATASVPPVPAGAGPDVPPPVPAGSLGDQLAAGSPPTGGASAWMWLLFGALGFLGGQVLAVLAVSVSALVAGRFHDLAALAKLTEPPTWYIVATLFGLWGGFFGAALLASRLRGTGRLAGDLGLRFRPADLLGVPIGVAGQYLVALLYLPIAQHVHDFHRRFDAPSQRLTGSSHGVAYALIVVCTVVGAPFFEELFFRGVLLRALGRLFGPAGRRVGPSAAVVVSAGIFGWAHAESLQFLGLALFGVLLGVVAWRTGRLGMNMVAHASFNGIALLAVVVPGVATLVGLH